MKLPWIFFASSLAFNFALIAWIGTHGATSRDREMGSTSGGVTSPIALKLNSTQAAALLSGDLAAMKAAGVPDEVANVLAAGRAYAKYESLQLKQRKARGLDPEYWRESPSKKFEVTDAQRAEESALEKTFNDAMAKAFPNLVQDDENDATTYSFLPTPTREKLKRIEKDYDELEAEINAKIESGFVLPSDTAKLKLLHEEKNRDIAAALSPAEFETLQLHDSDTARTIRSHYGDAITSETDYRKVFALQQAFNSHYGNEEDIESENSTPAEHAERRDAFVQLQTQIRAVIGDENYATFQRANDQDYKDLTALTKRIELPANTPDVIYATRDAYALQSQAIAQNASLTEDVRNELLKTLAEKARATLQSKLGAEGAEAYADRSDWINYLKNGSSFTTNPNDGPAYHEAGRTVFPYTAPRTSNSGPVVLPR